MTPNEVKDAVESALRDLGLYRTHWYGPANRMTSLGTYKKVLGVWYHVNYNQHFTPFATPWSQWTKAKISEQLNLWMKRNKADIEAYLIDLPSLRFQLGANCECGACHTKDDNLHSRWCPAYKDTK